MPSELRTAKGGEPTARDFADLRAALWRLAAGEPDVRIATGCCLDGPTLRAFGTLARALDAAPMIEGDQATCRTGRPYAAVVSVDRLGALRDLGAGWAEQIVAELGARILGAVPDARLRRVGRSALEFVFQAEDAVAAHGWIEALHSSLESQIAVDEQVVELPVVIGFAEGEPGAAPTDGLMEAAEHALGRAQAGHLKMAMFDEIARGERSDRLSLMRDLRPALDTEDVFLCYQPKLDARTGRLCAAEALIRWRHPKRGMVPPDRFIGLAEQTGEIRRITERVLLRAIRDQATMHAAGRPLAIDVNISAGLLCDDRFVTWALKQVAQAVDAIGFEVTETAVMTDPDHALANMKAIAAAGVAIAIDDYGSGLSSLAYLKQLPASEIKIDKAFISGLVSSHRDPLIVRSTIELAHALDMKVTAEGVDNATSLALLTVMGCDLLQGYAISPPLPMHDLLALLERTDGLMSLGIQTSEAEPSGSTSSASGLTKIRQFITRS